MHVMVVKFLFIQFISLTSLIVTCCFSLDWMQYCELLTRNKWSEGWLSGMRRDVCARRQRRIESISRPTAYIRLKVKCWQCRWNFFEKQFNPFASECARRLELCRIRLDKYSISLGWQKNEKRDIFRYLFFSDFKKVTISRLNNIVCQIL